MLECSTGNSKSQLHKARLKLRELLRQPQNLVPVEGLDGAAAVTGGAR
jgi:RNA polymerase sigma-70 factor (ECF subfamily)